MQRLAVGTRMYWELVCSPLRGQYAYLLVGVAAIFRCIGGMEDFAGSVEGFVVRLRISLKNPLAC